MAGASILSYLRFLRGLRTVPIFVAGRHENGTVPLAPSKRPGAGVAGSARAAWRRQARAAVGHGKGWPAALFWAARLSVGGAGGAVAAPRAGQPPEHLAARTGASRAARSREVDLRPAADAAALVQSVGLAGRPPLRRGGGMGLRRGGQGNRSAAAAGPTPTRCCNWTPPSGRVRPITPPPRAAAFPLAFNVYSVPKSRKTRS